MSRRSSYEPYLLLEFEDPFELLFDEKGSELELFEVLFDVFVLVFSA